MIRRLTHLPTNRMPMIAAPTTERTSPHHDLARAARRRLESTAYPSIRRLDCDCDEQGVLYLRGRLSSYYQKQLAQEAVFDLPGAAEIVNEVEVVGVLPKL